MAQPKAPTYARAPAHLRTLCITSLCASILVLQTGAAHATVLDYGLGAQIYVQATAGDQITNTDHAFAVKSNAPVSYNFTSTASGRGINGLAASATGSTTAFYGYLDVAGSGFATPAAGNGAASRVISYVGGDPLASFFDQVQVTSNSLAVGAPTTITLQLHYSGAASFQSEAAPGYKSSSFINSLYKLRYLNRSLPQNEIDIAHGIGNFSESIVVPVQVGDILQLNGALYAGGEAASYDALGPSSFVFNDPSTLNIGGLAPGVTLVTGSGHNYAGTIPAVPEPASAVMMSVGLLALVAVRRRKG